MGARHTRLALPVPVREQWRQHHSTLHCRLPDKGSNAGESGSGAPVPRRVAMLTSPWRRPPGLSLRRPQRAHRRCRQPLRGSGSPRACTAGALTLPSPLRQVRMTAGGGGAVLGSCRPPPLAIADTPAITASARTLQLLLHSGVVLSRSAGALTYSSKMRRPASQKRQVHRMSCSSSCLPGVRLYCRFVCFAPWHHPLHSSSQIALCAFLGVQSPRCHRCRFRAQCSLHLWLRAV